MERKYNTPRRNRYDTQGINENSMLMYKEGFEPRCPDRCNSQTH